MYYEILSKWQMSNSWESAWIPFQFSESGKKFDLQIAESIKFCWENVEPTNGIIKFLVSNNQSSFKVLKEFHINTNSNKEDVLFLSILFPHFEYFKIILELNGTSNGELTIGILFG
ncbi:MAG: hypothetical protein ACUVQ1_08535 [Candidatus Kapaibacteriales bacterium]